MFQEITCNKEKSTIFYTILCIQSHGVSEICWRRSPACKMDTCRASLWCGHDDALWGCQNERTPCRNRRICATFRHCGLTGDVAYSLLTQNQCRIEGNCKASQGFLQAGIHGTHISYNHFKVWVWTTIIEYLQLSNDENPIAGDHRIDQRLWTLLVASIWPFLPLFPLHPGRIPQWKPLEPIICDKTGFWKLMISTHRFPSNLALPNCYPSSFRSIRMIPPNGQ